MQETRYLKVQNVFKLCDLHNEDHKYKERSIIIIIIINSVGTY